MLSMQIALGVDIGDDAVRVVALRGSDAAATIIMAAQAPLTDDHTPGEVAAALGPLLQPLGLGRVRVAAALPASGCALKIADLPPARPADLAQVVTFEAENQFPLPLHELVWGYTLSPLPTGRQHAVIAGARTPLVESRLSVLRQVGLEPAVLMPAPLAAADTGPHPAGIHLVVVAGAQWSDLCLYDGPRLLGCRSILAGTPGAEGWAARIAREARPWLAGNDRVQGIQLLGSVTASMAGALAQAMSLPVALGDPWKELRDPSGLQREMEDAPLAYATAIGLAKAALRRAPRLNLLPSHVTAGYAHRRKQGYTLALLGLVAVLLVPVVLDSWTALTLQQIEVRKVTQKVKTTQRAMPAPPSTGALTARTTLEALQAPESQPLELLRELSAKLPQGLTLTDFTYDRGKGLLLLKGRSKTHATIAKAVRTLPQVPGVEQAQLNYALLDKTETGQVYDFQITGQLAVNGDPTIASGRRKAAARTGMRVQ